MDDPIEFKKILQEVMSQEPIAMLSKEGIHFDVLAMKVMELEEKKIYVLDELSNDKVNSCSVP